MELDENFYEELKEKIKPYFVKGGTHDFGHTKRVLNLALHIGEKEGADPEILKLAVLLHDIAHKEQDEANGKICHAERGAEISREILEEMGYENIPEIIHCIETHRFRKSNPPVSIEAKVLYDADKLDAIGAIGIGRAFSFSGAIGAIIHDPEISLEDPQEYTENDCAYHEYLVKLKYIKGKILTDEGKRIAESRHKFMDEFFKRLNKEVAGEL